MEEKTFERKHQEMVVRSLEDTFVLPYESFKKKNEKKKKIESNSLKNSERLSRDKKKKERKTYKMSSEKHQRFDQIKNEYSESEKFLKKNINSSNSNSIYKKIKIKPETIDRFFYSDSNEENQESTLFDNFGNGKILNIKKNEAISSFFLDENIKTVDKIKFSDKLYKNIQFLKKNSNIFLSRYELFQLFLSQLSFNQKNKTLGEKTLVEIITETHNRLFSIGVKNFLKGPSFFQDGDQEEKNSKDYINSKNKNIESNESKFLEFTNKLNEKISLSTQSKKTKSTKKKIKNFSYYLTWCFYNYFPIFTWFPQYKWKKYLKNDLIAGITVGVMLIAQGMAYAKLAGLAPEYGLYSSGLPLLIYPFFGTSRHLGVGPVALVSLLVSQVTMSTNKAGHDYSQNEKTSFALLIAFCVGLTQIFMGLIKIGFIINFISHPVIAGFTTAAAFVIILSQLQHVLGYAVNKSHYPFITLYNYVANLKKFQWQPFLFGTVNIFFMQSIKFINKKYKFELPGPIICVFISIFITQIFRLNRFGISIQNKIPGGFPSVKGPIFNEFIKVAPTVLTISFINFLETVAIASKIGEMHGYKIVPDQELIGSGMTNLLGSFVGAFPMAGSFSRTAVLSQAGAKTQVAGMITGIVIILTYLFFTPLFTYLPNVTLASIILVSVVNLIDYKEATHLLKIRFLDFFAFMISLISTFVFGVEWGIAMAVGVSLVFVLWFSIKPPTSVLGRIPGTVVYRDIKWYSGCIKTPGGILFRMDAPLFFVNSAVLRKKIYQEEDKYNEINPVSLFYIILDCRGMTDIDSTGLQVLSEIAEKYNKQGVFLGLANVNERVRKLMKAGKLDKLIKPENFFSRIHDGVESAVKWKIFHLKNF
jgi:high affinity sulfate transporter 1